MTASHPIRRRPAAATTIASTSPSRSLRSRVSTLPRSGRISRSGRAARSWARRRTLLVPTRAPARRDASRSPPRETRASKGASRLVTAASVIPEGSSERRSLAL